MGSSSIEVIIGRASWQRALSLMMWEDCMRQKVDEGVSEGGRGGKTPAIEQHRFKNVLLRVSTDQTEMGYRLSVRQSHELRKLCTKTHHYTNNSIDVSCCSLQLSWCMHSYYTHKLDKIQVRKL